MLFKKRISLSQMIVSLAMFCGLTQFSKSTCMEDKQNPTTTISNMNLESGIPITIARQILDPQHPTGEKVHRHFIKKNCSHSNNLNVDGNYYVQFSPDGSKFFVKDNDGQKIEIIDTKTHESVFTLDSFYDLKSWSPDNSLIILQSDNNNLEIWNIETGKFVAPLRTNRAELLWSPVNLLIAAKDPLEGTHINIFDAKTGKCITTLINNQKVASISWCPDSSLIATGSQDGKVKLWSVKTGTCKATFDHQDKVKHVAWSPDGWLVASSTAKLGTKIWDLKTKQCLGEFAGYNKGSSGVEYVFGSMGRISWSPDSSLLATIPLSDLVKIWNPKTGELVSTIPFSPGQFSQTIWHPDSTSIAMPFHDEKTKRNYVVVRNSKNGKIISSIPLSKTINFNNINILWLSDGKQLITQDLKNSKISFWKYYGTYEQAVERLLESIVRLSSKAEFPAKTFWQLFWNIVLPMTKE